MDKKELVEKILSLGSTISESSLQKMNKPSLEGLLATLEMTNQLKEQVEKLQAQTEETSPVAEEMPEKEIGNAATIFKTIDRSNTNAKQRLLLQNLHDDRLVQVMNGTSGKLFWQSPVTGMIINLPYYGAVDDITIKELKTMRNQSPKMLKDNNLIIIDEEVAAAFGLLDQYKDVMLPEQLEQTVLNFEELKGFAETASRQTKIMMIETAIKLYHEGRLIDARTIDYFEREFDVFLKDTIQNENVASAY